MEILIFTLFIFIISLVSCHCPTNKKAQSLTKEKSIVYTVPLFNILFLVCRDGNPLFGKTPPPTHRGKTYIVMNSVIEERENIFYDNAAKFLGKRCSILHFMNKYYTMGLNKQLNRFL